MLKNIWFLFLFVLFSCQQNQGRKDQIKLVSICALEFHLFDNSIAHSETNYFVDLLIENGSVFLLENEERMILSCSSDDTFEISYKVKRIDSNIFRIPIYLLEIENKNPTLMLKNRIDIIKDFLMNESCIMYDENLSERLRLKPNSGCSIKYFLNNVQISYIDLWVKFDINKRYPVPEDVIK